MTAQQTSLSDEYPIQTRGRNAIFLFLFLVLLVVRLAASLGETLHYDEPFWFIRGDLLVEGLLEGDWDSLQNEHWMVARMEGQRRLFNSYIATGTGTAFLTGLGRLLIPLAPGGEGIDGLLAEVVLSRLFHVLCSVLTPLLLLLLAKRLGLAWAGQAALLFYFIFDPILQEM